MRWDYYKDWQENAGYEDFHNNYSRLNPCVNERDTEKITEKEVFTD